MGLIGDPFAMATAAINAGAQAKQNQLQRQWNEMMYDKQRTHSLQDWDRQNDYNSPFKQRQRMEAAGLNPALMYGHGQVANTSNTPIQKAQALPWNPKAPQFDIGSIVQMAQARNINANTDKVKQEIQGIEHDNTIRALNAWISTNERKFLEEKHIPHMVQQPDGTQKELQMPAIEALLWSKHGTPLYDMKIRRQALQRAIIGTVQDQLSVELSQKQKKQMDAVLKSISLNNKYQEMVNHVMNLTKGETGYGPLADLIKIIGLTAIMSISGNTGSLLGRVIGSRYTKDINFNVGKK